MAKISQPQKIVRFLEEHPGQFFTARQIAEYLISTYSEDYAQKRNNPRFADDNAFLSQVVAEIGSQKDSLKSQNPMLTWQDRPKPRRYVVPLADETPQIEVPCQPEETFCDTSAENTLLEQELYPLLIGYLASELHLYCRRIRESCSSNTRGTGGNQWLHPDIVAMEPVDKDWNKHIRQCAKINGSVFVCGRLK